ncbi:MAG: NAD-dependent epimerase/dehydratase family protein [Deltaproteobacteria bacterium]|nr:NAD-dependent epimerase/dehydratase family protein [Deltaproteobacteria bacterium]MBI3294659.1 NAD-dependent epimerase/dehydratase family protein [Deltaproteobacteria bacterium]
MAQKALVIGGTGFIGRHIVRALIEAGFETTVTSRSTQPVLGNWVKADRAEIGSLKDLTSMPWDCVVDNIAYTGADVTQVIDALPRVAHWILNSTISVYRYCRAFSYPLIESGVDHSFKPKDENLADVHWKYARGKLDAELALIKSRKPFSVIRPTMVFGSGDITGRTQWYVDRIREGQTILTTAQNRFQLVSPQDAGQAFALVAKAKARGLFNLAQNEAFTLDEFVHSLAKAGGHTAHTAPLTAANKDQAGPYLFPNPWDLSTTALRKLGWLPTQWEHLARSVW